MEKYSRNQRLAIAVAAILAALICIANLVYWTVVAPEHPRLKHDLAFGILMVLSLLMAWFAWPAAPQSTRTDTLALPREGTR